MTKGVRIDDLARLKAEVADQCEGEIRKLLDANGGGRSTYARLIGEAKQAIRGRPEGPRVEPRTIRELGKAFDGVKAIADQLVLKIPDAVSKLEDFFSKLFPAIAELKALLDRPELARADLSTVRPMFVAAEEKLAEIPRLLEQLKPLRNARDSESLVRALEALQGVLPFDERWRQLTVLLRLQTEFSRGEDFQALAVPSENRSQRTMLAEHFAAGLPVRNGGKETLLPAKRRTLACLSILVGNWPSGSVWNLDGPLVPPGPTVAEVIEFERQAMGPAITRTRAK